MILRDVSSIVVDEAAYTDVLESNNPNAELDIVGRLEVGAERAIRELECNVTQLGSSIATMVCCRVTEHVEKDRLVQTDDEVNRGVALRSKLVGLIKYLGHAQLLLDRRQRELRGLDDAIRYGGITRSGRSSCHLADEGETANPVEQVAGIDHSCPGSQHSEAGRCHCAIEPAGNERNCIQVRANS